mgnify:CR=1 FL=1
MKTYILYEIFSLFQAEINFFSSEIKLIIILLRMNFSLHKRLIFLDFIITGASFATFAITIMYVCKINDRSMCGKSWQWEGGNVERRNYLKPGKIY